jgi:hypothetical protein
MNAGEISMVGVLSPYLMFVVPISEDGVAFVLAYRYTNHLF